MALKRKFGTQNDLSATFVKDAHTPVETIYVIGYVGYFASPDMWLQTPQNSPGMNGAARRFIRRPWSWTASAAPSHGEGRAIASSGQDPTDGSGNERAVRSSSAILVNV